MTKSGDKSKVLKMYGYMFDKLQFIEETGMSIKARFALVFLNINVSLKKELGIAKVICKPPVLVPQTAQKSSLSKIEETKRM